MHTYTNTVDPVRWLQRCAVMPHFTSDFYLDVNKPHDKNKTNNELTLRKASYGWDLCGCEDPGVSTSISSFAKERPKCAFTVYKSAAVLKYEQSLTITVCVTEAWYISFLHVIELHCCPINYKRHIHEAHDMFLHYYEYDKCVLIHS